MTSTDRVVQIGTRSIQCVTIAGLGKLGGDRSSITLRKWEEKGWLPPCNLRMPEKEVGGKMVAGERLYTKKYAELMGIEIQKVQRGVAVPLQVKTNLYQLIKQEREEFLK